MSVTGKDNGEGTKEEKLDTIGISLTQEDLTNILHVGNVGVTTEAGKDVPPGVKLEDP